MPTQQSSATGLAQRLHRALALGEAFSGAAIASSLRTLTPDIGPVFVEVDSNKSFKDSRFSLSPELGVTLGVSVGFETVAATITTAGGRELLRFRHPVAVPDQLGQPDQVQVRVSEVVKHAFEELLPAAWTALAGQAPERVPLIGAALATPLWADPTGRPVGTRYDEAWTEAETETPLHRGHRMLVDALAQLSSSPRNTINEVTTVANMFACEALATAYRWSPERDDQSPLAAHDPNWRTLLVVHAGCGLGAATIRLPPFPSTDGAVQFSFLHARVHGGALGGAGAIGHLKVPFGSALAQCSCGTQRETHLEQVASGYALAQQLLNQLADDTRARHRDRRIEFMLDLQRLQPGRFAELASQSGEQIGLALGPVATTIDPVMTVASGFLATEEFRDALASALQKAGPRPCGAGSVHVTDPDETMYLAARGAALLQMRNRAWRRWPGFHALGQPPTIKVSTNKAIKTNLEREAAWINYD